MNLIPQTPGKSPNYYCTWRVQHPQWSITTDEEFAAFDYFKATEGGNAARRNMNEASLLGSNGWATRFWPTIRGDLFICLDDGWDVPADIEAWHQRWKFGSLMLDETRFPSFSGTPADRLQRINDKVKQLGWRGVALWVACQCVGDAHDGQETPEADAVEYWRERARWSAQAGIEYWKVDWGHRQDSLSYRRMITDIAHIEAPALIVEHARCMDPVNNISGDGRFDKWPTVCDANLATLNFSDVLRSYDTLSTATTLDRVAIFAQQGSSAAGLVNCEDDLYLGAAFGCSLGIMRPPIKNPYTKWQWKNIDEAVRAVRWQRLAPAIRLGASKCLVSDAILTDSWRQPGKHWFAPINDILIKQHAPAIMSRDSALPVVTSQGEAPFVVASRNPSGAFAVAALPRRVDGRPSSPADVVCEVPDGCDTIGIFGSYASLRLRCTSTTAIRRIMAQDLAADAAVDITREAVIDNDGILLSGSLIHKTGLSAATSDDPSEPGLVMRIER